MQDYIRQRVLEISHYIIESNSTVRQAANVFGVSKSTVHKDMTERLPEINEKIYLQVRNVLDQNKAERHLRGGEATRKKFKDVEVS
ncbi:sporulation transcriptional regulator SpoIIID [Bacillota bacterium LX-D]|nr:sporulation transcriptional regulator SpoIIID [Bacillota bacterium LX-D]